MRSLNVLAAGLISVWAMAAGAAEPAKKPAPAPAAAPVVAQPLLIEPGAIDAALKGLVDSQYIV
jgi:hypothetical protein